MGGNALKQFGIETDRLPKAEYDKIVDEVVTIIKDTLDHGGYIRKVKPILAYKNKQDFGDADILMCSDELNPNWIELLTKAFNSKAIYNNGDVCSFEYKNFQIDVIKTPRYEFDIAYCYFSYNDLGNLVGKLFHKFGLKFGHDGLKYVYRDEDHILAEITITHNFKDVCEFLGLDHSKWVDGFDELEDIFKWVASSKYFNPDIYLLDNLNHIARVRDRKRKTYNAFLEWCKTWEGEKYEFKKDKALYLPMLFEYWNKTSDWDLERTFETEYMEVYKNSLVKKEMAKKFNGVLVREITGLDGKPLGDFMRHLKNIITNVIIVTQSKDAIAEIIEKEWKNYGNENMY